MTVRAGDTTAPQRRDARRNRQLLVEAGHEVFTEQGLQAPLDVIARRAGVGNATLYRHFLTRAALVDAVFRGQLTGTTEAGERARAAADAWTGLNDYLQAVFGTLAADRGTNDLMTTHVKGIEALDSVHAHNRETMELLLERGREEGAIRADVTTEDVLFALAALGRAVPALTAATTPDAWHRPLALLLDGLRPAPAPLPDPALTTAQLGDALRELGPHRTAVRVAGGASAGARCRAWHRPGRAEAGRRPPRAGHRATAAGHPRRQRPGHSGRCGSGPSAQSGAPVFSCAARCGQPPNSRASSAAGPTASSFIKRLAMAPSPRPNTSARPDSEAPRAHWPSKSSSSCGVHLW